MNTTIIYSDLYDSDKTIKEQLVGAILHGGYWAYKYCRSHPRNYYCSKEKLNCYIIKK